MKVKKRVIEIYECEFRNLIEELKGMDRDERETLYRCHSKRVFPKSKETINLEDQFTYSERYQASDSGDIRPLG